MQKVFVTLSKFGFQERDYAVKAHWIKDGFEAGDTGRRGFYLYY